MWTYSQRRGVLDHNSDIVGVGYSGSIEGKNDPAKQNVPKVGPIPRGTYTIGEAFDSAKHGPHCMRLTPDETNAMFGRDGFLIHGDSTDHPGAASEGCIIMTIAVRLRVSASGDSKLRVTE